MTVDEARQAIFSQFNTGWASETPIAWDNLDYKPEGNEFVRLSVQHNLGSQESLGGVGNRVFRKSGFVFVQIFTPLGIAADRNDFLAQKALEIFYNTSSSVWFRNQQINDVGLSADDNYFQQNVSVEFIYDDIK